MGVSSSIVLYLGYLKAKKQVVTLYLVFNPKVGPEPLAYICVVPYCAGKTMCKSVNDKEKIRRYERGMVRRIMGLNKSPDEEYRRRKIEMWRTLCAERT